MNATQLYLTLLNIYSIDQPIAVRLTCIAIHESNLKPNAINYNRNGSIDRGLFQINSIHLKVWKMEEYELFIPQTNIQAAIYVYNRQGLTAWAVHKKCV